MAKVYTDIWNGFQFRAPIYLDGHYEPHKFDLIKWKDCEPVEDINSITGEKKIATKFCFTVGTLIWHPEEQYFSFNSCGLRYFTYHTDGLEQFILKFCERMEKELQNRNNE